MEDLLYGSVFESSERLDIIDCAGEGDKQMIPRGSIVTWGPDLDRQGLSVLRSLYVVPADILIDAVDDWESSENVYVELLKCC